MKMEKYKTLLSFRSEKRDKIPRPFFDDVAFHCDGFRVEKCTYTSPITIN